MSVEFAKKNVLAALLIILVLILIVAISAIIVERSGNDFHLVVPSTGTIVPSTPVLSVFVSPPGYPQAGGFWKINVYIQNKTSAYIPAYNATVVVTAGTGGWIKKSYELRTDDKGEASFQFLPEYNSIAFQAHYSGISSEKLILTTSYISVEVLDTLLIFNAFSAVGSLASDLVYKPKKKGKLIVWINLTRFMSISILCVFSFVTLICIYSKVFLSTEWGYPENIINGYISFALLKNVFYAGVILFFAYWIIKLIIKGIESSSNTQA